MPKRALTRVDVPRTYPELRDAVLAVVRKGRREIEQAWVQTYHDTGRLIHEHLLFKQARADYGAGVFADLAADSGIAKRTLHEWVQFYRCFPIVRSNAQLTRTHYLLLCQVGDVKQRVTLTDQANKGDWSFPRTETAVARARLPGAEHARGSGGEALRRWARGQGDAHRHPDDEAG